MPSRPHAPPAGSTPELVAIRPPQRPIPQGGLPNLRNLDYSGLAQWLGQNLGGPRFRTDQVFSWLHNRRVHDFAAMTNLGKADRERLERLAECGRLSVDSVRSAHDGTRKLRVRTRDGSAIESVLIPNEGRGWTLCVSSMIGCSLTCRFCATATLGFVRNLAPWEIVDQVYCAQEVLDRATRDQEHQERVSNLVFMGMGEPLHNYNHVRRALEILTDERGAGIRGRRVTVSTAGFVPGIERFASEGLGRDVGLAISLNATTDEVRTRIMPINSKWNIAALLAAVRSVASPDRRRITFEYVLLADVNDSDEDALRLVHLLADIDCQVNLIPFNEHREAVFQRPDWSRIQQFADLCRANNLHTFVRTPRGEDIAAACGQLALEEPG